MLPAFPADASNMTDCLQKYFLNILLYLTKAARQMDSRS
jgi:hypothetical protein